MFRKRGKSSKENLRRRLPVGFAGVLFLFILAGCNLPGASRPPTADVVAIYTQAAQTVAAQLTALAALTTPMPLALPTIETITAIASPTFALTPTGEVSPTPSPTPTPPPTLAAELVFEDDFSTEGKWYTEQNPDFGFQYEDGTYLVYVNLLDGAVWSVREQSFTDVILEVDAGRLSGVKSGYYGLTCRHQGEDDYYALVVGSDGFYGIARMLAGEFEFLEQGLDGSGIIRSGEAGNRLRAECLGESLTLYANGQKLLEVRDDQLSSGDVGLLAGTRKERGIEVWFDNFAIYQP